MPLSSQEGFEQGDPSLPFPQRGMPLADVRGGSLIMGACRREGAASALGGLELLDTEGLGRGWREQGRPSASQGKEPADEPHLAGTLNLGFPASRI